MAQIWREWAERESKAGSVLKSFREKRDHSTRKAPDRRTGPARRQIRFPSIRDAGGAGRRHQRTAPFFRGRGLPQHTGVYERARRRSQNRQGHGSRDRPRAAGLEEQLARARRREFRNDYAAAGGESGRAASLAESHRRRLAAE